MNLGKDMKKYCSKCPCFSMEFVFSDSRKESSDGYMVGRCCNKGRKVNGFGTLAYFFGFKISDELRERCSFGATGFRYDETPKAFSEKVEEYIGSKDCILENNDKDCMFYAERNLEEWNEEWNEE